MQVIPNAWGVGDSPSVWPLEVSSREMRGLSEQDTVNLPTQLQDGPGEAEAFCPLTLRSLILGRVG